MDRERTILERVIEDEELMNSEEEAEEKKWTEEFQKRKTEMTKQQKKSEERRKKAYKKIEDLSHRWRCLEQRRGKRVGEYLARMATTLADDRAKRENTFA